MSTTEKLPKRKTKRQTRPIKEEKNWLEWCVFGISLLLVLSILGYLLYIELVPVSKDVTFRLSVGDYRNPDNQFQIPVKIRNQSNQTARDVTVEVTSGNNPEEHSELKFDYVPRHSEREGMAVFDKDPGEVKARVRSFNLP